MKDVISDSSTGGAPRQRSTAKTPSSVADTAADKGTLKETLLLLWDDLPHWRRDNSYIRSGYRHIKPSYTHSLFSLTHLHNESVNIWSHLLGAIVAIGAAAYSYLLVHPRYDSASNGDVIAFAAFFGGAVSCLGMSATFHALLSHSEDVARWGNKLDYTGIVVLIVGSYVPALYYGFFCTPQLMKSYLSLVSPGLTLNLDGY